MTWNASGTSAKSAQFTVAQEEEIAKLFMEEDAVNSTPCLISFNDVLKDVKTTFLCFDGSDACLERRGLSIQRHIVADRNSAEDIPPTDEAGAPFVINEEQRWFTVTHLLARSIFFPYSFPPPHTDQAPGMGQDEASTSSTSSDPPLDTELTDPAHFSPQDDVQLLSLAVWRRIYVNALSLMLPDLQLGFQVRRMEDLSAVSESVMLEWLKAPALSEEDPLYPLYAFLCPRVSAVEAGVEPLTPQVLSSVLLLDTERWVSCWYPALKDYTNGVKVMWDTLPPMPLRVPQTSTREDLYSYYAQIARLTNMKEPVYCAIEDRDTIEEVLVDLHRMLQFEVRAKDDADRTRGVAVPTRWMRQLAAWLQQCREYLYHLCWNVFSPIGTEQEEEPAFPVPPGPIPTMEIMQLVQSCSTSMDAAVKHRLSSRRLGTVSDHNDTEEDAFAPVEVIPAGVFDFFSVHFGIAGPRYICYGLFQYHHRLVNLLEPPCIFTEVNFDLESSTAEKTLKVGNRIMEIQSHNKQCSVTVEAYPSTTVADVVRSCLVMGREEGSFTDEEEAMWLSAVGGDPYVKARQNAHEDVMVYVSFVKDVIYPPPPNALKGGAAAGGKEEGEGTHLEELELTTDTVGRVLAKVKMFCQTTGKPYPVTGKEKRVEVTLRAIYRPKRGDRERQRERDEAAAEVSHNLSTYGSSVTRTSWPPGTCGLSNVGNTCFMNSSLQCLAHLDSFREKLFSLMLSNERFAQVTVALQNLFIGMWSGSQRIVNTSDFKVQMQHRRSRYTGYQQQDANEFIDELLDCMSEELNQCIVPKYRERHEEDHRIPAPELSRLFWEDFLANNTSFIPEMFFHQSKSRFECAVCHAFSVVFEQDSSLSVPIREVPQAANVKVMMLVELDGFVESRPGGGEEEEAGDASGHGEPYLLEKFVRLSASMKIQAGPTLPPARIDQLLRIVSRHQKVAESVAVLRQKQPGRSRTGPGTEEKEEEEEEAALPEAFHTELVELWEHEEIPGTYYLHLRCRPKPPAALPQKHVAPVYYCFAPKPLQNYPSSTYTLLPEFMYFEDFGDLLLSEGEDHSSSAMSQAILHRSIELGEKLLRAVPNSYMTQSPYHVDPLDTGLASEHTIVCSVPLGYDNHVAAELEERPVRKESIHVQPMLLDFASEVRASSLSTYGPIGVSKENLIEVSKARKIGGDEWIHQYYERCKTASRMTGPLHSSEYPPLVVMILYKEEECHFVKEVMPISNIGHYGEMTIADEHQGWDNTLEKSLHMALCCSNTLTGEDSWYCPRCKAFVTAETRRSLFRLPPCLVLSFRRFRQQGYRVMKNAAKINFPDYLDLKPYLDEDADDSQPTGYRLKGVLYHSGTLDFGHYTASAYVTPRQRWVHFNDTHTMPEISPARANAYVLCYEREDVLVRRRSDDRPAMDFGRMTGM